MPYGKAYSAMNALIPVKEGLVRFLTSKNEIL